MFRHSCHTKQLLDSVITTPFLDFRPRVRYQAPETLFETIVTDFPFSCSTLVIQEATFYLPTSITKPMEEQTLRIIGMTKSRAGDGSWISPIVRPVPAVVRPKTHFTCLCPKSVFQSRFEALSQKTISTPISCAICDSHDGLFGRNRNRCEEERRHSVGSHSCILKSDNAINSC